MDNNQTNSNKKRKRINRDKKSPDKLPPQAPRNSEEDPFRQGSDTVTTAIEQFTEVFLHGGNMVLPRAMPTRVVPRSFTRNFTIQNVRAASVKVEPTLRDPITITTSSGAVSGDYSGQEGTLTGPAAVNTVNYSVDFGLVKTDGTHFKPSDQTIPGVEPLQQIRWVNKVHEGIQADYFASGQHHKPMLYEGKLTAVSGTITVSYAVVVPTVGWALTITSYDADYTILDVVTPSAATTAVGTDFTLSTVPIAGAFFSFSLSRITEVTGDIVNLDASTAVLNATTSHVNTFSADPAIDKDYAPILENMQKWSHISTSLVVSNRQSTFADGGNACTAVVSRDYPVALFPTVMYDQITQLHKSQYHLSSIKDGTHASYLPEDISQWFFKDQTVNHTGGPSTYAAFVAPSLNAVDDILSLNVEVTMHYEYIIPSQAFDPVLSTNHTSLLFAVLGAIRRHELSKDSRLIGENPDHFARIKRLAKKVAKDNDVRQAARSALTVIKGMAKTALPILAGAML